GEAGDRDASSLTKLQLLVLCVRVGGYGVSRCCHAAPTRPAALRGPSGYRQPRLPSGSARDRLLSSALKVRDGPGPVELVSNRTVTTPSPAPCTQPCPKSGCATSIPGNHDAGSEPRRTVGAGTGSGSHPSAPASGAGLRSSSGNSDSWRTVESPPNPTPTNRI